MKRRERNSKEKSPIRGREKKRKGGKRVRTESEMVQTGEGSLLTSKRFYILRYIAIAAMILDYIGAVLYGMNKANILGAELYMAIRMIGRISFPIFAFELVEAFHYTKSKVKHLLWLIVLMMLSEYPYNLAFVYPMENEIGMRIYTERNQSVMFTMVCGYLMLMMYNVNWREPISKYMSKGWQEAFNIIMKIMAIVLFLVVSDICYGEYGYHGIYLIAGFEISRGRKYNKIWQAISMLIYIYTWKRLMLIYSVSLVALVIIYLGEGIKAKKTPLIYKAESIKTKDKKEAKPIITSRLSKYICRFSYPVLLVMLTLMRIANS